MRNEMPIYKGILMSMVNGDAVASVSRNFKLNYNENDMLM